MNKQMQIAAIIVLGVFLSCQSSLNPPNESLIYNGIVVSETTPDFAAANGQARVGAPSGQIEPLPPYGTVYGHESDPDNVYLSQGGEQLPSGSWIDQVNDETYTTTLFSNGVHTLENLTLITISNAVNTQYLDENGNWIDVDSDITVQANAVATGAGGACDISTSDRGVLMAGGGGGVNG